MGDEIAIKVEGVYKDFRLPHEKNNSLKSLFTSNHKKRDKGFEAQHALKDISFEIKKGEFFGIVGRNGSGKSTLLKIIAEIYRPTKGRVTKQGRLVPFIELGVGFNPELTGKENVFLNGALLGFSQKEVEGMYDDIVEFAELERFMDQKLKNYSSGMQVRLAFSVATRAKADILLIDEVLAVGDADFQRKCFEYFKKLKQNKKTVVFVSHDMDSVRQFCDRAVLIDKSHLIQEDNPDIIAQQYSKLFLKENKIETREEKRWSSGAAHFNNPKIDKKIITDADETISFGAKVEFKEKIDSPVFGFKISDTSGKNITGTNSALIHHKTMNYSKGSTVDLQWDVPDIFSNGDYIIDLAMVDDVGRDIDVWNGVLQFSVMKSIKTPYIVTPKLTLTIK